MRFVYPILLVLAACHPRIYRSAVSGTLLGIDDAYSLRWATNGRTALLIHDSTLPYTPGPPVLPVVLLVTRDGRTDSLSLKAADTLVLRLPEKDSLSIRRLPDGDSTPRYRYMRLVAHKYGKDSTRDFQIAFVRPSFLDSLGFMVRVSGDSLVASGEADARRWGDLFSILALSNDMHRDLVVTHAGVSAVLRPGEAPSLVFRDTPVAGAWVIGTRMTESEKSNLSTIPAFLKIRVIIKHR